MTKKQHPNGYWTLENTIAECEQIVKQKGNLPTQRKFIEMGMSSLATAINKYGGLHKMRKKLKIEKLTSEKPKNYWSPERVMTTYQNLTRKLGHPPSAQELRSMDYAGMEWVISHNLGGFRTIRKIMGVEDLQRKGYWTPKRSFDTCKALVKEFGDLPSQNELLDLARKRDDLKGLPSAIGRLGGLRKFRAKLQIDQRTKPNYYWNKKKVLAEAKIIVKEIGYFPAHNKLRAMGRGDFVGGIRSSGYTYFQIRKDLGLEVLKMEDNYWTESIILEECRKIIAVEGDLPSSSKIIKLGYAALASQISKQLGYPELRKKLGLEQKVKPEGYWMDEKRIVKEAKNLMKKHQLKSLPSQSKLHKMGYSGMAAAITKYHGGFFEFRNKLGEKNIKAKNGSLKSWEYVQKTLGDMISELGHFPNSSDFRKKRQGALEQALYKYHGGYNQVKERFYQSTGLHTESQQLESMLLSYLQPKERDVHA